MDDTHYKNKTIYILEYIENNPNGEWKHTRKLQEIFDEPYKLKERYKELRELQDYWSEYDEFKFYSGTIQEFNLIL